MDAIMQAEKGFIGLAYASSGGGTNMQGEKPLG